MLRALPRCRFLVRGAALASATNCAIIVFMHRIVVSLLCLTALACAHTIPARSAFVLTSPAFGEGDTLPDSTVLNGLACSGPNLSPALEWRNAPAGT